MKAVKFGIFSLLLALFMFGCSGDSKAPEYLKDKKIEFHFSSASGRFANLKGYRRYVYFNDSNTYEWRTRSGILEDSGSYTYGAQSNNTGMITLLSNYGTNAGQEIEIKLYFSSSRSGRFEGSITQGDATGKITGRFKVKNKS